MNKKQTITIEISIPDEWSEYELIDTGNGKKFERFGRYRFIRPEPQALWQPARTDWDTADAIFSDDDSQDRWTFRTKLPQRWNLTYKDIRFWAKATPFRHLGVFPEQATQWEWMLAQIAQARSPLRVLHIFGYTGIASLLLAKAGVQVTHVDASKTVVEWACENQRLSGLGQAPIRWIVDDALKFVQREERRGVRYDGIILDPPKFGRGPKGEVWKLEESLPFLLRCCRGVLTEKPLFIVLTAYAIRASSLSMSQLLADVMQSFSGTVSGGELVTREKSAVPVKLGSGQVKLGSGQVRLGSGQVKLGSGQVKLGSGQVKLGAGRYLSHALFSRWKTLSNG